MARVVTSGTRLASRKEKRAASFPFVRVHHPESESFRSSRGYMAQNVRESRTGAPGAPRFIGFETTFLLH